MRNAAAAPRVATMTPPMAGPTLRAMLNPKALAMMAEGTCSRGTCSPIDACHAGAKDAVPQPMRKVKSSKEPGVTSPAKAMPASAAEATSMTPCETNITIRRSWVSANAPASSDRKKNGSAPAVCTRATICGESVMVAICHDAPTVWMRPPKDDTSAAHQKVANTRCWKGARVPWRQRGVRGSGVEVMAARE